MTRTLTMLTASMLVPSILVLGCLQPAFADNKGKKNKDRDQSSAAEVVTDVLITAAEIAIINEFIREYGAGAFGTPQGLPPGIAKNYARGKPLPPGIAKRYLPGTLLSRLPERPGYEWLVVDRDILLVVAGTALIVDLLDDAF